MQVLLHQPASLSSSRAGTIPNHAYRPSGAVGFALLFFFLNLNPHHGRSFREHMREFDFVGLLLIVAGVVLILLGFNFSETSCECLVLAATRLING